MKQHENSFVKKHKKIDNILFNYDLLETDQNCLGNITGAMEEIERAGYYRGFRACLILVAVPVLLVSVLLINKLITLL